MGCLSVGYFQGTKHKSISWQGGGFEHGTSGLQKQLPKHQATLPPHTFFLIFKGKLSLLHSRYQGYHATLLPNLNNTCEGDLATTLTTALHSVKNIPGPGLNHWYILQIQIKLTKKGISHPTFLDILNNTRNVHTTPVI